MSPPYSWLNSKPNKTPADSQQSIAALLFALFFSCEDGHDMFLLNVIWLSMDYSYIDYSTQVRTQFNRNKKISQTRKSSFTTSIQNKKISSCREAPLKVTF
jgi:hypothetical protein